MANTVKWEVGQTVQVESRTWAGINKPGGCAKITKVHWTADGNYVNGLDVKYLVGGGFEKAIDPAIVSVFETLERGGRKRRSREFLMEREDCVRNTGHNERIATIRKSSTSRKTGKCPMLHNVETPAAVSSKPAPAPADQVIAKESSHSNQSTTVFSTPEKRNKTKPKKVTPIPSLVVTKIKVDTVSPMTEDPLVHKDNARPPAARRGLVFGKAGKKEDEKVPSLPQVECQPQQLFQQRLQHVTKVDAEKKNEKAGTGKKQAKGFNKSTDVDPKVGTTRSNGGSHSLGISKKAACKQAPSFARTLSAYSGSKPTIGSSENPAAVANRKPLLDVYRYEVQKAHEFMNEMVGPRHQDAGDLKENASNVRCDQFLKTFQTLRGRIEDEGAVSEDQFQDLFNSATRQTFSAEEIELHLQSLCSEGKIMKSDGMIFLID